MMKTNATRYRWWIFWTMFIAANLIVSYYRYPGFKNAIHEGFHALISGDQAVIGEWAARLGPWAPFALIVAMTAEMFLIVVPSFVLIVVAVLSFGPFWGFWVSIVGVFVATSVGYIIGRYFKTLVVKKFIGVEREKKIERYVDRYGYWVVFITRLSPLISSDAISFAGGLLEMKYWKFIAATLAGTIPLAGMLAFFGSENRAFENGLIGLSILSLVGLIVYIYYDYRRGS